MSKKTLTFVLLPFLVLVFLGFFLFSRSNTNLIQEIKDLPSPIMEPVQGVIPFVEMTIPYLRSRTYQSDLGPLSLVSQNNNYQTYLTDYDSDGLKINALLTKPQGDVPEGGWPAIVFIHGYIPPSSYQTQERYVDYVNYLARNNFVVFKIDLRGHGDSEGEPTGAYYSADYIIDTLNAVAALRNTYFVNPDQVGLWGHSMAGNVILRALAAQPDIPAAVIWAGAVYSYEDWTKYRINDDSYRPPQITSERQRRREQLFNTHGEFNTNSTFWKLVAATNYLDDFNTAIQLHHAINDDVVDIGYSRDLNIMLDQTNLPHQFYEYQNGGHNLSGQSFSQAMQRTVEFYQQHLSGNQ